MSLRKRKITLMPAVALAALSALITIPALSQARLYAAAPEHFARITVAAGDDLWSLADSYTPSGQSVQETVDRIIAVNGLSDSSVVPGEHLKIPR
jgi:LysM repeat protein